MRYTNFEVDHMLESMKILIDTREQNTESLKRRIESFGCPSERCCLNVGDYSVAYTDIAGEPINLSNKVAVERKMNSDELCNCFTKGRERFRREFERAKEKNMKLHLIIENESWERVFAGKYRSRMNPDAIIASMLAWSIRYNFNIHFCKKETTGKLIYKILRYELKEILENA